MDKSLSQRSEFLVRNFGSLFEFLDFRRQRVAVAYQARGLFFGACKRSFDGTDSFAGDREFVLDGGEVVLEAGVVLFEVIEVRGEFVFGGASLDDFGGELFFGGCKT